MTVKTNILFTFLLYLSGSNYCVCQIIPYRYTVDARSAIGEYAKYDNSVSIKIAKAIDKHSEEKENAIKRRFEAITENYIKRLDNHTDSLDISIFLRDLEHLRVDLMDSLEMLVPLKLKAEQLIYISSSKVLFPVQNSTQAKMFFSFDGSGKDSQFLSHSFFSYNTTSSQLALYNELFSDFFGPVRFGFGALITGEQSKELDKETSNIEVNQDALQRLLSGGGNSVLSLAYPILQLKDANWTRGLRILAVPKYSIDIPALGSSIENYSANVDLGLEANAHWSGHNQNVALFFHFRTGYVMGNKSFQQAIRSNNNFRLSQFNFGVAFKNTIKLSYSLYKISNDTLGVNLPGFISFSLIPQL